LTQDNSKPGISNEALDKLRAWDIKKGKPVGYIVSGDPGFAKPAGNNYLGLANKLVKASYLGFDFAMMTLEETSEVHEPMLREQMKVVKEKTGFNFGLHLNVRMDLTLAYGQQWSLWHKILIDSVKGAVDKIQPKWVLFHSSSNIRPVSVNPKQGQAILFSPWGTNIGSFIKNDGITYYSENTSLIYGKKIDDLKHKDNSDKPYMQDWFMSYYLDEYVKINLAGIVKARNYFRRRLKKDIGFTEAFSVISYVSKKIFEYDKKLDNEIYGVENELEKCHKNEPENSEKYKELYLKFQKLKNEKNVKLTNFSDELFKKNDFDERTFGTILEISKYNFYDLFETWVKEGSVADESVAYHIIAKWMWKTKDKMWAYVLSDITDSKNPFSDEFDPDNIVQNSELVARITVPLSKMVTAVAGKYIEGHLKVNSFEGGMRIDGETSKESTNPPHTTSIHSHKNLLNDNECYKDIKGEVIKTQSLYDYLKDEGLTIYIETNMPSVDNNEGRLRVMSILDHVEICRAIDDGEMINYCMDTEHLNLNYLNPVDEAKLLERWRDKTGLNPNKYFSMFHLNAPRPLWGVHGAIRRLSLDPEILYEQLWAMRKADIKNAYIIWEWGSWGNPGESAIVYRDLKDCLIQEIEPENLPPRLFGIDESFKAMQQFAVREHAFDMLKDNLFMFSLPDRTMRSTNAFNKNKMNVWLKSRYK